MSININKMVSDLAHQSQGTNGLNNAMQKMTAKSKQAASSDKAAMSINMKSLSQGVGASQATEGGSKGRLLNTTDTSHGAANVKNTEREVSGAQAQITAADKVQISPPGAQQGSMPQGVLSKLHE